jgi:hypothetical protein
MRIHDTARGGAIAAEIAMSILQRLGTCTIDFPAESKHCSHPVVMKPTGLFKREETFEVDSVPYLWDAAGGAKGGKLYRLEDEKAGARVLVAEYAATKWFQNRCVLVMDTKLLDELVVLASSVSVLNRQL